MKDRIYICHTYYHVYVTFLKELKLRAEADPAKKAGAATLVLSKMSNNFENLKSRVESTGLFEEVLEFDEKREDFFPELEKYREDTGSFLGNLKNRIRFTKEYARLEASYVPVDLRTYKDIYVYCDSDPIGYYLNQNHIRYHAVEDGLNCLKNFDAARYDNRGHFKIKAFLSGNPVHNAQGILFVAYLTDADRTGQQGAPVLGVYADELTGFCLFSQICSDPHVKNSGCDLLLGKHSCCDFLFHVIVLFSSIYNAIALL